MQYLVLLIILSWNLPFSLSIQYTSTTVSQTNEIIKMTDFLDDLKGKYAHEPTFLQAVEEMALSLKPCLLCDCRTGTNSQISCELDG